ncbi:UNVERIFIED_CONTAM: spore coat protein YutH [Brevibacillus sp. OAP136]
MEEIAAKLQEKYGLRVFGGQEVGSRYEMDTDSGTYYLFSCPAAYRSKAKFVGSVEQHLAKAPRIHLLPSATTYQNEGYFLHDDKLYYVKQGVRSGSLANEAYVIGESLARFHQATASFTGEKSFRTFSSLGNWPELWRQKLKQFDEHRDHLDDQEEVTPFDEYLLTTYTYVSQLGDAAVQYLEGTGYTKKAKAPGKYGKVAFQNFDESFVFFAESGEQLVAGEWSWILDIRSRDIAQWIKSDIRRNGWDEQKVLAFLTGYTDVEPLAEEEFAWVYALLMYPGRFLKQVEMVRQSAEEEEEELEDMGDWEAKLDGELLAMEPVLQHFPRLVSNRYGATIPALEWSLWNNS